MPTLPNPPTTTPLTINIKRKLTLIDVIHKLQELTHDEYNTDEIPAYGAREKPTYKDSRHVLTIEERLQMDGATSFQQFEIRISALMKQLRHFHNASGELGSSTRTQSLAVILRKRLKPFLFLFQENAANLFPHKVDHPERKIRNHTEWKDDPDLSLLPELLEEFAADLDRFQECLGEFREVVDEVIKSAIESFEVDLKYWALCLKEYDKELENRDPAIQRYVQELMAEVGVHLENMANTLSLFIHTSIPTIRFIQRHRTSNTTNLSTIATFFSGVTATTLQISLGQTRTPLGDTVNAFWFSSLVFSIAAVINSLLGSTWNQARYRSPLHHMPWWVLIWIQDSPLIFLVFSVACFSAGLVLLPYSTYQSHATSSIVTVLTAFTTFGFVTVAIWFALERWVSHRHKGQKWLNDVLKEMTNSYGIKTVNHATEGTRPSTNTLLHIDIQHPNRPDVSEESGSRQADNATPPALASPPNERLQRDTSSHSPARIRFICMVRSVIKNQIKEKMLPERRQELITQYKDYKSVSRAPVLKLKLKTLNRTPHSYDHDALVRHLQFSPDGKFLATSSWDRTSVILRVGPPLELHHILLHPRGFVGQVAWSPNGEILLTRLKCSIKVWTVKDGVCVKTIDRKCDVQSIAWFPTGEDFISIEGNDATRLDLTGKVLNKYSFGRLKLYDVAITPTANRLLGVGALLSPPTEPHPRKSSKVEKQLVVFNMITNKFESKTPVLSDVRDITIARNGLVALVSYENKAPPQLWRLELDKSTNTTRLTLRHVFLPKVSVEFAGQSYFGGRDDELVLCAARAGDLHIWDRVTAVLLHHICAQDVGGDLTCVAWNPAADNPVMFATGSQIGEVRIWNSHTTEIKAAEETDEPEPMTSSPTCSDGQ